MTAVLTPTPKFQAFDNNGRPLVGGKLFTYEAGTTTKLATYVDSGGVTPNANPVILDYRGEANIWIPPNVPYKYVLAPSTDTDPPTAPIWTVDQLVSSQLITLYGGVDTGVTDAYVLDFDANFIAYTDGIVIYWIPSNSNVSNSTINVNGLGPIAILNQDGSQLQQNQLVANTIAVIMYQGGNFLLVQSGVAPAFTAGSFTATLAGFSGAPTFTARYYVVGRMCMLFLPSTTGTSTGTSFNISGLPSAIQPAFRQAVMLGVMTDNSTPVYGQVAVIRGSPSSFIDFYLNGDVAGWTGSGDKGIGDNGGNVDVVLMYFI